MRFEGLSPVLIVGRVEPTRAFFTGLGFEVLTEVPHGDGLGFSMLQKDDVTVMIQSRASVLDDVGTDVAQAIEETILERGAVGLYFNVDDLAGVVSATAGTEVIMPLRKTFYGADEIMLREPGGHAVTFASHAAAA